MSDAGRELHEDIGALKASLAAQDKRLDKIETNVEKLLEYAATTKGGWRVLFGVATAAGAVGAGIAKLFAMVKGGA